MPGKLQLAWEMGVEAISSRSRARSAPGERPSSPWHWRCSCSSWWPTVPRSSASDLEIEWLGTPTSDINVTLALALIVIVPVHVASIRSRGLSGYVKHYVSQPFPKFLFPVNAFINGVEEIAKPLTLALRLFGNLLSGGLMLALIAALGVWTIFHVPIGYGFTPLLDLIWKPFDLAIGAIQAFIFALLTILYFDSAMSTEHA